MEEPSNVGTEYAFGVEVWCILAIQQIFPNHVWVECHHLRRKEKP